MRKMHLLPCIGLLLLACGNPPKNVEETKIEAPIPPKEYSIDQFYKNTNISGGRFSEDETKLLVNSNESGIYNLYEIEIATGKQTQITHSTEDSYYGIDYVPGTSQILYSADKGGNEISHIYLLKEDGTSEDLTPGDAVKASFAGWTNDHKAFYYMSTKRDPKFFDVYKMNIENWESEMIYENEGGLDFSGITENEKMMALRKTITSSSNHLYLKNRENGETIEISDPEAKSAYRSAGFSEDGQYFYFITNAGGEFSVLKQYDIAANTASTIYETNWDVSYSGLSENETYRTIGINEDGSTTLLVKNTEDGSELKLPEIEGADIAGASFSKSENLVRLTASTSTGPSNIYVYNLETEALNKLTETLNPDIDPNDLVSAEVIRYKSFDDLEIPAIYYKPKTASADNKVPALVWVHGGPGGQSRCNYFPLIQYLTNHGYAILAVNNRGSSGYGKSFHRMDDKNHGDKDLKDCIWAKKWLAGKDYVDAEKIGILGGSYGGYMTMAAMTFEPDEFKVGVNLFGVTNWLRTLKSIPPFWESFREALYTEMGDPATDSVRLYNISPLFHAENVKNPVMVLQGANDPRVLQVESDEIVEAVKKNGVPVEYVVFPDEGHGFVKKENEIEAYGKVLVFLDHYLKGENTAN